MAYEKQEWVNNISLVDEERMNHIENGIYQNSLDIEKLNEKNVITVGLNASQTITTTDDTKLFLNTIKAQIGTNLNLNDGAIVIGSGISYVKISSQIEIPSHTTDGLRRLLIYKNNSIYARAMKFVSSNYETLALPNILMPVTGGDIISLYVKNDGESTTISSDNRDTFLTVEVIN